MTPTPAAPFLDRLEQTGLLEAWFLQTLREQAAASKTPTTADAIAKRLVRSGHLTKLQASKLLADAADDVAAASSPSSTATGKAPPKSPPTAPSASPAEPSYASIDEELGLAPLPGDELTTSPSTSAPPAQPNQRAAKTPDGAARSPAARSEPKTAEPRASQTRPAEIKPGAAQPAGPARPVPPPLEPFDALEPTGGLELIDDVPPLGGVGGLEELDLGAGLDQLESPALADDALGSPSGALQAGRRLGRKPKAGSPWDSTLMYAGGGGLALLLIAGVVLWYLLTRVSAAELLQAADEAYRSGSYSQAIPNYERFLAKYPDDPNVSLARVRIGTARIRQVLEGSKDKQPALKVATEVLPTIENESAFDEARAELASILPEIAEGFSQPAKVEMDVAKSQTLVDLAAQALQLVNNPAYIPTSLRRPVETRIDNIHEDIELARRNINQSKRLDETVAAIRQAAQAGDTARAYDERRRLLSEYPGLEQNAQLLDAVSAITQRQRELVQIVNDALPGVRDDHPPRVEFGIALASRRGPGKPGNDRQMVCFLARGSVFGLQASTGQLKWRRSVGYDTLANPQPLARQPGADVIVGDARHQEVLRLASETGNLVWRTPIGEPFAEPVVKDAQILVATRGGRLLALDAETGDATHCVKLPQPLSVGPGVSEAGHLYQVAEHSNVYVLDEATLECKDVYYLGHKPGTVAAAPVLALGHLFVIENNGAAHSDLHVLATDANGLAPRPAIKPIRLRGRVEAPLALVGARVFVVTDLGEIHVYEVNPANAKAPVTDAVEPIVASYKSPITGYPAFDAGRLWVGDQRFTKYDVQTSRNRLVRQWIKDERDVFVAPPIVIGDTVYHLRRRRDSPAYTAAAIAGDDGKVFWETDLAVPMALLSIDGERKQIHAISVQAELFELTAENMQAGRTTIIDQAVATGGAVVRGQAFPDAQPLDNARWALTSPTERSHAVIYDPGAATPGGRLRDVLLKAAGSAHIVATPTFALDGLIVPSDNGQVLLLDLLTGDNKVLPFQPPVEAGVKVGWQRAAAIGAERREFVIADNRRKLFRVGIKDQPEPHLAELAQVRLEVDLASALASVGDTVYGAVRGATNDTILSFNAADLAAGAAWPLEGRVVWGPQSVGGLVLVATDRQKLLAFETGQKQRWTSPLSYGPLVGRPLSADDNLILASLSGTVWRISAQDGTQSGQVDAGEHLAAGPVAFGGSRLLVGAADGAVLVLPTLP